MRFCCLVILGYYHFMSVTLIGLGNPDKYRDTKHNVGKDFLRRLAVEKGIEFTKLQNGVYCSEFNTDNGKISLCISDGYINESGKNFSCILKEKDNFIVVHDDVDICLGDIKVSVGAGHAGHNGIRSIIDRLKSKDFKRFRIGISKPANDVDMSEYVLESFKNEEKEMLDASFEKFKVRVEEECRCVEEKNQSTRGGIRGLLGRLFR